MSSRILLTGGRQRKVGADFELHRCDAAVVLALDVETRTVTTEFLYESPLEVRAGEDATVLFKAGHSTGEYVYLCTTTEVLICNVHDPSQVVRKISHPYFNDVHHVVPSRTEGRIIVVSTGLDCVFELDLDGEVVNEWPVLDEDIWQRFDRNVDYRKVLSTKPHRAHPNYAFYLGERLYVNRCNRRDCVALDGAEPSIQYGDLGAVGHDGVIVDDRILITSVNGRIAEFDARTLQRLRTVDLNADANHQPLGWCRGIAELDDGRWLVGFSRLRPTKWKENLGWVKSKVPWAGTAPKRPTRVACYNPAEGSLEWEIDLEAHGMGEIFSILSGSRSSGPGVRNEG